MRWPWPSWCQSGSLAWGWSGLWRCTGWCGSCTLQHSRVIMKNWWWIRRYFYVTIHFPTVCYIRSPVASICAAVVTVSPNRQYRGIVKPTTPATTGPEHTDTSVSSTDGSRKSWKYLKMWPLFLFCSSGLVGLVTYFQIVYCIVDCTINPKTVWM